MNEVAAPTTPAATPVPAPADPPPAATVIRGHVLTLRYPPDLPVVRERAAIQAAVKANPVVIVCGDTGSGKSTQLPKLLLELGRGARGMIGHTQPRRIAARSVAQRLADELGLELGGLVGFQVRFTDRTRRSTLIKVMTDGILLAEIRADPDLSRYDTLIIDEAHERSLNIDFLLGYLRDLLPRRPDLKLLITSATIDAAHFSEYFGAAPVVTVTGRTWPIETRYRPPVDDGEDAFDPGLNAGVIAAVTEILTEPSDVAREDILVFLPGEREIRDCAEVLSGQYGERLEVLPLFSRLSWEQQRRVFEREHRQRVVLATNVAETSLTVPGIHSVIDSGVARISRYSPRAKLQRLLVEPISQASANQRRGRCGRVGPGLCIRLYTEEDYNARPAQTTPEVQRTNLARVILQMAALGLGDCTEFPFIDPPETRLVSDGYRLLAELQAVDEQRRVTQIGQLMSRLPIDPRVARMLIAAQHLGVLREMLPLAAVMSLQDPRERPAERAGTADQRHAAWSDARSDFITLLNLWAAYQTQRQRLSRSALRRWCAGQFLSAVRLREWEELVGQLQDVAGELGWRASEQPADYATLHRALLCGLLSNIGQKIEGGAVRGEYRGARDLRYLIAPGTAVRSRAPRWIVCAQIVESARVYARGVAMVEPQWIEWAARHLLKREFLEPHWNPRRGTVYARERVMLYGLVLAADRRVDYGRVAPAEARQIFVHEALVSGNSRLNAPFLTHNAALKAQLAAEEAALRRHAILVDEITQAQFYLARIPPEVNSLDRFEGWRWRAERANSRLLYMQEADLRLPDAPVLDRACFPTHWAVGESLLPVSYEFNPGSPADGATLRVPMMLARTLDRGDLDWSIEGWRLDKIIAILRGLPKVQRRELVPVPAVAERLLRRLSPKRATAFYEALSDALRAETNLQISADVLASIALPLWLRLNLVLLDLEGHVIATSREAGDLRRAGRSPAVRCEREGLRTWDFDELPERVTVEQQGVRLELFPTLADRGDSAALFLQADAQCAAAITRQGVLRLLSLALAPTMRLLTREVAGERDLVLLHHTIGATNQWPIDIVERALLRISLPAELATPRTRAQFESARERGQRGLADAVRSLAQQVRGILAQNLQVTRALEALSPALNADLINDLRRAQARLIPPGFVCTTPDPWLDSLPRYLQALERRIAKLPGARGAGARAQAELPVRWERYEALSALADSLDTQRPAVLVELRWLIEEYAVSLFAQELKTAVTVSSKRLDETELAARRALDVLR
ncbi:MAG TPA: ATP-dependent RNA helicase HrpA [Steroidobacteraceae bacterium]|jgi:ATP-dependent helicase HrpA|nr:ATP-dependent RNA helicase HrpA [Steroidobacteraceae bacterium]